MSRNGSHTRLLKQLSALIIFLRLSFRYCDSLDIWNVHVEPSRARITPSQGTSGLDALEESEMGLLLLSASVTSSSSRTPQGLHEMASQVPSQSNRLADYFVICGLDETAGLELEQTSEDEYENLTPLEKPYKSRVLAHYPEHVSWNPFDEKATRMLCMPGCLTFRTGKKIPGPKYHTFLVTREDGSRCYGYALTIFEEVKDRNICSAIRTLQEMHLAEVTSRRRYYGGRDTYTNSLPHSMKIGNRKLQLASCQDKSDSTLYDMAKDRLFVSKCLCYISQHQFVSAFRVLLLSLYDRYIAAPPHELPIESYVYNVLYEISTPNPGQSSRFSFYPDSFFLLQKPNEQELPLCEYSLRVFFGLFGVESAIDLIACASLEHQILICSKDNFLLMLVAEAISNLLFPFSWQHVYVPVLPESMKSFLDAPVPYIMGLHRRDVTGDMPKFEGNVCFVDIEGQKVRLPEDVPAFPDRMEFARELKDVIKCYGATLNTEFLRHRVQHKDRGFPRKFSLTDMTEADTFKSSHRQDLSAEGRKISMQSDAGNAGIQGYSDKSRATTKLNTDAGTMYLISYIDDMKFNNAVREVFLNRFVQIFYSYDHFVLQAGRDTINSRESVHTFDKATFLSDQPDTHVPFLSFFLETQMFATFIDGKISIAFGEYSPALAVFDSRVEKLKDQMGESLVRAVKYQPCSTIERSEYALAQRVKRLDTASPKPGKLVDCRVSKSIEAEASGFPLLDTKVLNPEIQPIKRLAVNAKKRETAPTVIIGSYEQRQLFQDNRIKMTRQQSVAEPTSSLMATENWDFVEKLLKECKSRTKKMLVDKLSKEAVELGHNEGYVTGVEENTQIASLCDLLERVWSHGLHNKQGKSSLWSHLLAYQQRHETAENAKQIHTAESSSAFAWQVLRRRLELVSPSKPPIKYVDIPGFGNVSFTRIHRFMDSVKLSNDLTSVNLEVAGQGNGDQSRGRLSADGNLTSLPPSLIFDMKNVLAMPEIKSALGYARAWVRLSLEKKLLSTHLKVLLSDTQLLENLYKRYAFLRNEDEREQFIYHLLSLNAVDFYCFTNTFTSTLIPYRVIIYPSRKYSSTVPSSFWFCLSGALGDSGNVVSTKNSHLQIIFQRKNLGLLTTVRIGLDKNLPRSKWLIDYILVRNEVTGYLAKFPCGRWLGRGVDDGSIERLLVAEYAQPVVDGHGSPGGDYSTLPRTPQRCRSPSANRKSNELRFSVPEIQQMLGDAVNSIVKHLYKPEKERGSMTVLLCGEMGLIFCIEQALMYGYSPSRLIRQNYLWNIFEKSDQFFRTELLGEKRMIPERRENIRLFCRAVRQINRCLHSLGKDGKFLLFAALSLRDRCLDRWLALVSSCPIVDSVYDRHSFMRDPELFQFLIEIVQSLDEFKIVLEPSLTKGLEV